MKFTRAFFLITAVSLLLLQGCAKDLAILRGIHQKPDQKVDKNNTTIEACADFLNTVSGENYTKFGDGILCKDDVLITATPLTIDVIQTLVKKRALERRWDNKKFKENLDADLRAFTNFRFDYSSSKIVPKAQGDSTISNTMSFKVVIENNTDPFRTIEVDGGFECFFLENGKGIYGRVESITDDYLFDYLQLDGYMSTIITFSTTNDFGKPLFGDKTSSKEFSLVFNGIQTKPIKINWNLTF